MTGTLFNLYNKNISEIYYRLTVCRASSFVVFLKVKEG